MYTRQTSGGCSVCLSVGLKGIKTGLERKTGQIMKDLVDFTNDFGLLFCRYCNTKIIHFAFYMYYNTDWRSISATRSL